VPQCRSPATADCAAAPSARSGPVHNNDRLFFVQLYRWFPSILKAIKIIRPETPGALASCRILPLLVLEISELGRPAANQWDLRALIRRMSAENLLWGGPRIHGELLKLGLAVAQSTVASLHGNALSEPRCCPFRYGRLGGPVRTGHLRAHPRQDRRLQAQGAVGRRHGAARLRHKGSKISVNEAEAEQVRSIFCSYLRLGSLNMLMADLRKQGILTKVRTLKTGERHPVHAWAARLPAS
jgi:hypothetical protein